uniref:Uncharacterized protein n=1 Tax=Gopherus agassizii TaxID=38772 RepID=A0A452IDQ8_9SAUR
MNPSNEPLQTLSLQQLSVRGEASLPSCGNSSMAGVREGILSAAAVGPCWGWREGAFPTQRAEFQGSLFGVHITERKRITRIYCYDLD